MRKYFWYCYSSILEAQEKYCDNIKKDWKLCTEPQVKKTDVKGYALFKEPKYKFPDFLPDGKYVKRQPIRKKSSNDPRPCKDGSDYDAATNTCKKCFVKGQYVHKLDIATGKSLPTLIEDVYIND